jgi:hypothetical protein
MIVDAVSIPFMTKAVPVTINLVHLLLVRLRVGHILLRMNKVLAPLDSQYLLGNNKPCQFVEFLNTSKSSFSLVNCPLSDGMRPLSEVWSKVSSIKEVRRPISLGIGESSALRPNCNSVSFGK